MAIATPHIQPIPEDEMDELWFGFRQQTFGELQSAYRESGMPSQDIAHRIGKDPATVSRCLRGKENITLRTMHALARGMGCRLRVEIDRLDQIPRVNREHGEAWNATRRETTSAASNKFELKMSGS